MNLDFMSDFYGGKHSASCLDTLLIKCCLQQQCLITFLRTVCLLICLLSICLFTCAFLSLSVYMSVILSVCCRNVFLCLSVYLYTSLSVCLFTILSFGCDLLFVSHCVCFSYSHCSVFICQFYVILNCPSHPDICCDHLTF